MAPNTPAALIQVTNMVNFVGCNEGTEESCVPWRIILLPHTIGLAILRLIIISTTSTGQYSINPAHYRTVWLVPDTGSGGADDLVSSLPRTELIKIPLANFNVLREQAALGETVINGEDQLSIKFYWSTKDEVPRGQSGQNGPDCLRLPSVAALGALTNPETLLITGLCSASLATTGQFRVAERTMHIDKGPKYMPSLPYALYTVISKILASLPDVENNGNLPDVVNAVAGAIEDVVEGFDTQRACDVVAKAQTVPASEILGAHLEVAVGVTAQA
ncbi:hypothetical protein DFP72DRAFT_853204 [Ephemerocybe angulata]|uniref:Uncharacterized protein n=1 Tax=Ephemerocybe angulata TaxID=980116 RepID=A0A8H6LZL9_9AGAR|nr:hypothetical protein DFP72DRAFT_853204 [Tulosesus angulatus]